MLKGGWTIFLTAENTTMFKTSTQTCAAFIRLSVYSCQKNTHVKSVTFISVAG